MTTGIYILATVDATLDHTDRQPAMRSEATAGVDTSAPQRRTSSAAATWEPGTTALTPSLRYTAAARDAFNASPPPKRA